MARSRRLKFLLTIGLALSLIALSVFAQKRNTLRIDSEPPGATIEANGQYLGTTPFTWKIGNFAFNPKKRWLYSKRLSIPITLTLAKEGYVERSILVTRGPFVWRSTNGLNSFQYYLIPDTRVFVKLEKIDQFFGSNPYRTSELRERDEVQELDSMAENSRPLTTANIVQRTLPAIVSIKSERGSGSGFIISSNGVIVTNKHVVELSDRVTVVTSRGERFSDAVVFTHPQKDLALIRLNVGDPLPFIRLADPAEVEVGAEVVAIGSPLGVFQNTVTKGVISAFRKTEPDGVLLQTDAAMNRGNSGGPLLNRRGNVVAVNTMKIAGPDVVGINFGISSGEVLQMLSDYFDYVPDYLEPGTLAAHEPPPSQAKRDRALVSFGSEPTGAEIFVDDRFMGSTPSQLSLAHGEHLVEISRPGFKVWHRKILVDSDSSQFINAILQEPQVGRDAVHTVAAENQSVTESPPLQSGDSGTEVALALLLQESHVALQLKSDRNVDFSFQRWSVVNETPPSYLLKLTAIHRISRRPVHFIWSVNTETGEVQAMSQAARDLERSLGNSEPRSKSLSRFDDFPAIPKTHSPLAHSNLEMCL